MKKTQKLNSMIAGIIAFIPAFFTTSSIKAFPYGCDGVVAYSCGSSDTNAIYQDFRDNCCAGSEITVVDLCENEIFPFYNVHNGVNCGC